MARVKSIASRRHRKILKKARGFRDSRHKRVKTAKEALLHAGQYAYTGRRLRKRDMRALWIMRINAAARVNGTTYKKLINDLKKANIELNRKILSDIANTDTATFSKIVEKAKSFK